MHQTVLHENFPVFIMRIEKSDCAFATLKEVVDYYVRQVEAHPFAQLIGVFDHHAHTRSLEEGDIAPEIQGAMNVVTCFGMAIPSAESLALGPRSIGIADVGDRFVVSFLETPMPIANSAMETWTRGLVTHRISNDSFNEGTMVSPPHVDCNNKSSQSMT